MPKSITQHNKDYYTEIAGATFGKNTILELFNTNNVETVGSVTYVGKETASGGWLVTKIDATSGTVITYATKANNASYKTYSEAWTDRASLTYNIYSVAFAS